VNLLLDPAREADHLHLLDVAGARPVTEAVEDVDDRALVGRERPGSNRRRKDEHGDEEDDR
jgi:hypothetical protein